MDTGIDLEMWRKTFLQLNSQAKTNYCCHAAVLDSWGKSYPTNKRLEKVQYKSVFFCT